MSDEDKIQQVARVIAEGLGYDYADLYKNKQEGRQDRWQRHDINMVRQDDCVEAARNVLEGLDKEARELLLEVLYRREIGIRHGRQTNRTETRA